MFDPDNPPDTYKKFKKELKRTLEDAEIDSDEEYETALFIVNRDNEGEVIFAEQIYEDHEGKITPDQILMVAMPIYIKAFNSKYFGLVLPTLHNKADGTERDIVLLITSDVANMEIVEAELDREQDLIELEPWEKQNVEDFIDIALPLRRAITLQG